MYSTFFQFDETCTGWKEDRSYYSHAKNEHVKYESFIMEKFIEHIPKKKTMWVMGVFHATNHSARRAILFQSFRHFNEKDKTCVGYVIDLL